MDKFDDMRSQDFRSCPRAVRVLEGHITGCDALANGEVAVVISIPSLGWTKVILAFPRKEAERLAEALPSTIKAAAEYTNHQRN